MKTSRSITMWWRGEEAGQFAILGRGGDEEVPADYVEVSWYMGPDDANWLLNAHAWSNSADAFWSYRETEHDAHREDPYVRALLQIPGAVPEEVALQGWVLSAQAWADSAHAWSYQETEPEEIALQGPTPTDWTPFEDGSER